MKQSKQALTIEGFGKMPGMEFRLQDGRILWRYLVERGDYPGFDSLWRVMSDQERRDTMRMGGRVASWLRSLEATGKD